MYTSLPIILSVLLPYCAVFSAAASDDCFKQTRDSYTTTSNTTSRVSAPIVCSEAENKTCDLPSGGFLNVPSSLTIKSAHEAEIFDTIGKVVNTEFKKSVYGAVSNSTFPIEPGRSGHVGFTAILRCYDGVIVGSECFDDVPAGQEVTACHPSVLPGNNPNGVPTLEGVSAFVTTGNGTALDTTDNSATSSTGGSAAMSTDNPAATTKPDDDSGAVKLFGQGSSWSTMMLMVTVAVVATGIGSCPIVF